MIDIITGRAPPPAQAESHRSKGSRELARPGPSLLEALGLRRHRRCYPKSSMDKSEPTRGRKSVFT